MKWVISRAKLSPEGFFVFYKFISFIDIAINDIIPLTYTGRNNSVNLSQKKAGSRMERPPKLRFQDYPVKRKRVVQRK